jgi:hypothetical protein
MCIAPPLGNSIYCFNILCLIGGKMFFIIIQDVVPLKIKINLN